MRVASPSVELPGGAWVHDECYRTASASNPLQFKVCQCTIRSSARRQSRAVATSEGKRRGGARRNVTAGGLTSGPVDA